jgi:hypothetical protein
MTTHDRDRIISAAKDAGFEHWDQFPLGYKQKLERFYAIAHEAGCVAEREECAKLLLNGSFLHDKSPGKQLAEDAAKVIRARSTK